MFMLLYWNRGFHKLDEIGNIVNIGIRGFTTWKQKNSNKMLPSVSIEPLAKDSKSSMPPYPNWALACKA